MAWVILLAAIPATFFISHRVSPLLGIGVGYTMILLSVLLLAARSRSKRHE